MKIENVAISDLNPAEYNPRSWSKKATSELTESITKFGLVDPIICNSAPDRKNIVIGGHFRLQIAKSLKYTEVPVFYIQIPEIEREKELNIRLNKNTGDWDFELLKNFDLDMLLDSGFDSKSLNSIWDKFLGVENDKFSTKEEEEKLNEPRVKPGQIYQLGKHRLACGDAIDEELIKKLMGKETASVLYCDPPFNIGMDYDQGFGKKSKYGGKTNDSKSEEDYQALIVKSLRNGLKALSPNAHIFYFCDENYIWLIQQSFRENDIGLKRVCLWIKNNQNPTSQTAFNKSYEPCIYGTIGKPHLSPINNLTEILNKEIGTGNDTFDNLWSVKRLPGTEYEHPTEKPPVLHEKPLRRCSKPGEIVLDLFGGSGSTLIACEQIKRRCFIVEIEPIFCDLIIKRYENLTGNKAELLEESCTTKKN